MTGVISIEEIRAHIADIRSTGDHARPELIDARRATVSFGARDVLNLAEYGREISAGGPMAPRAMVVQGLVHFGMARLFSSVASPWVRFSVFDDDIPAAEAWLVDISTDA